MSENIQLPNHTFPTTQGEVNLAELTNEWLVLYFYPKDSTPGCTTQAIGFSCLKDQFDALMVSCSSGTGFVFEMMMYWQDWIEEHGFNEEVSKKLTIETFLGASLLAAQSAGVNIEELQSRVTSKKGVTAAGLNSMRELEIERALRLSFEKAAMRSQEISRTMK